jgi:FkbM family methyltransferase
VAVDIGANVGYFTILLAKLLGPDGRVIAAEPLYGTELRANLKLNDISRVETVDAAFSDQNGQATIYQPRGEDAAYASLRSFGRRETGTRVRCVTLDSISEEWPSLKWIKMDVEGAEYQVLRGGSTAIARFRPHIVLEWSSDALKAMGAGEDELFGFLKDSGYELFGSCNNMGPLSLPTPTEDAHTVLATPNAGELKLVPWDRAFH